MSRYLNNATEELEFIDTAMNIFKKYEYKFLFGHIGDDKLKRKTIDVFNKHDEKLDELMELCFNSWPCNKPTTQAQSINDEQSLVQSQSSKQAPDQDQIDFPINSPLFDLSNDQDLFGLIWSLDFTS